jgi:hypothetical protein
MQSPDGYLFIYSLFKPVALGAGTAPTPRPGTCPVAPAVYLLGQTIYYALLRRRVVPDMYLGEMEDGWGW